MVRVVLSGGWIRADWVSRLTTDVMCLAGFGQPERFINLHADGTFVYYVKKVNEITQKLEIID